MTLQFIYSHVFPFLNSVGAAYACWRNVRAARRGLPNDAPMRMIIAGLSLFYVFAYATLWTGLVTDRLHWSQILAGAAVLTWFGPWAWPADAGVKNYEELKDSLNSHHEEMCQERVAREEEESE